MKHNGYRILGLIFLALVMLAGAQVVFSQVSPNYDLHWNVFSSGGGLRGSPNATLNDSLGQWSFGTSTSSDYRIIPGFWAGSGEEEFAIYLPMIRR